MATTMILSMAPIPRGTSPSCSNCGMILEESSAMLAEAQRRIQDLEEQVTLLNQKCTSAVDRLADYEDEILLLKSQAVSSSRPQPTPTHTQSYQSRLSTFLGTRKTLASVLPSTSTSPSVGNTPDLQALYNNEVLLRKKAESALSTANKALSNSSSELEELSTQLFIQANEMVATERKARAKLEERVSVLEDRDKEKRRRLEKLEGAVVRIERVRGLLGVGS